MPGQRGLKAVFLLVCLGLAGHAPDACGQSDGSAALQRNAAAPGRSLADALASLQAAGLDLVFSNRLVRPEYRVTSQPDLGLPLPKQAAALLEPFGLALERSRGDLWYVVRRRPQPSAAPEPSQPAAVAPRIEELVVTSPRYRLVRDEHDRRHLAARDLEDMPSVGRDLLRSVNQLPGQASVGVSARSHMRGGDSNEVLYLVNGVQIIQPFHMEDFHALLSTINPSLIDSVNVYHAGFPADFGTRLSGVVDMKLVEPNRPLEGQVRADFVSAAAQAGGRAGRARWLVSARRSVLDSALDRLNQDYGEPRFHDELMHLSWEGDDTGVDAGALYSSDRLSLRDPGAGETADADYENLTTWVSANHDLSDRLELEVAGSYTAIDNERQGSLDAPVDAVGTLNDQRKFTVTSYRGAVRWRAGGRWLLHAGLEGEVQSGDFQVAIATRYGILGLPLQPSHELMRNESAHRKGSLMSAFLSAQQMLTDSLTVEYGARYDLQDLDPAHDHQWSPRIQVTYDAGRPWRVFLNIGRYAQHQNLYELQLDDGRLQLNESQRADQVSLGTDWRASGRWRLRLEGYWRRIADPWPRYENIYNPWVLLPELHADRVSVVPERARTYGLETMVEYRPDGALSASLSLGLSRAEERLGGEWRPRPWEQRRTLRGSLDWRPARWRIGVAAIWHSGWPTTNLITRPLTDTTRLSDGSLPDYFSLDLHVARDFALPRSRLEVYFDVSNATSADNVGGYRYSLESGSLEREERQLLPGVPVLGMSWSW